MSKNVKLIDVQPEIAASTFSGWDLDVKPWSA